MWWQKPRRETSSTPSLVETDVTTFAYAAHHHGWHMTTIPVRDLLVLWNTKDTAWWGIMTWSPHVSNLKYEETRVKALEAPQRWVCSSNPDPMDSRQGSFEPRLDAHWPWKISLVLCGFIWKYISVNSIASNPVAQSRLDLTLVPDGVLTIPKFFIAYFTKHLTLADPSDVPVLSSTSFLYFLIGLY